MTILLRIIATMLRQPMKLLAAVQAIIALGLLAGWWSLGDDPDATAGAIMLAISAIFAAASEYLTPIFDAVLGEGTAVRLTKGGTGTVVKDA